MICAKKKLSISGDSWRCWGGLARWRRGFEFDFFHLRHERLVDFNVGGHQPLPRGFQVGEVRLPLLPHQVYENRYQQHKTLKIQFSTQPTKRY